MAMTLLTNQCLPTTLSHEVLTPDCRQAGITDLQGELPTAPDSLLLDTPLTNHFLLLTKQ
jgi:hypothetical protein